MDEQEEWLRLGVAAALTRSYAADQRGFVEDLAALLVSSFPESVQIVRGGFPLSRRRPIRQLRIQLGDDLFTMDCTSDGSPTARRSLSKRGIVLQTKELPMELWIAEIVARLEEAASQNQQALNALRRVLKDGGPC